jgi:hypothetical protein
VTAHEQAAGWAGPASTTSLRPGGAGPARGAPAPCPPWCTSKHRTVTDGHWVHSRYIGRDYRAVTLTQAGDQPPLIGLSGPDEDTDLEALAVEDALRLAALVDDLGADHLAGLLRQAARLAAQPSPLTQTTKTEDAA